MSRPSPAGIVISGIILAGLPFIAIAQHWHVESKDVRFAVPSQLEPQPYSENVDIDTEINRLNLDDLSGTDNIQVNDKVYIHMATGPDLIAYPFGISKNKARTRRGEHAFAIRATVTSREDREIEVRYNFETFLPSRNMKSVLSAMRNIPAAVELSVNQNSVARLVAVNIDGTRYPYRVIEKPVLKGLTR